MFLFPCIPCTSISLYQLGWSQLLGFLVYIMTFLLAVAGDVSASSEVPGFSPLCAITSLATANFSVNIASSIFTSFCFFFIDVFSFHAVFFLTLVAFLLSSWTSLVLAFFGGLCLALPLGIKHLDFQPVLLLGTRLLHHLRYLQNLLLSISAHLSLEFPTALLRSWPIDFSWFLLKRYFFFL